MKNIDKYIKTIYLASSPIREEMLESMIENALYNWNESASLDVLYSVIVDTFSFEPIKAEIREGLDRLESKGKVIFSSNEWELNSEAKKDIFSRELKNKKLDNERFENFEKLVLKFTLSQLSNESKENLWEKFNQYLIECFRIYAKDAINMFLPYNEKETENGDSKIYLNYYNKLSTQIEREIFEKLVNSYSENLTESDFIHLETLASRSESFFALGMPKEEHEKITDIKMLGWTMVADTNFLYSVLDLRPHNENDASQEIARLAKDKIVDLKIVYFPETLRELKKWTSNQISNINLTANQIKALLESDQLDPSARHFFQKKLINKDTPHPSVLLDKAQFILKSKGIEIYNSPEIKNLQDVENGQYMNEKYIEYSDYERFRNDIRVEKGLIEKDQKDEYKIEHDILLREGILTIRKGKNDINEIKHFGITLDETLISFDRYITKKTNRGLNFVPTFFKPSIFLRKIRTFIPIVAKDYHKAFFQAVTTKTYETKKSFSLAAQRSVAYFNSLGIDDKGVMLALISDEIFLKELQEWEEKGETDGERFVESEISKRFAKLAQEKEEIEKKSKEHEQSLKNELSLNRQKIADSQEEIQKVSFEKTSIQKEKEELLAKNEEAVKERDETEKRLQKLEKELAQEKADREREKAERELEELRTKYNSNKESFAKSQWKKEKEEATKGLKYGTFFILIIGGLMILGKVLENYLESLINNLQPSLLSQILLSILPTLVLIIPAIVFGIGQLTGRHLWDRHKTTISKAIDHFFRTDHKNYRLRRLKEFKETFNNSFSEPQNTEKETTLKS